MEESQIAEQKRRLRLLRSINSEKMQVRGKSIMAAIMLQSLILHDLHSSIQKVRKDISTMYEYGPDHPLCRKKARQISAGWEENEWVRCIVLEMISLLDSDDAERRRIALEVEKEMEAAEQKMNAA